VDLEDVTPELRDRVRRIPAIPVDRPWPRQAMRLLGRLMPAKRTPGVSITVQRLGRRSVRVFRPTQRGRAALLWIHGGGFVIGSPRQDDRLCGETAAALGMIVVSASYRLAPDHPFPAAADDCLAAWEWLQHSSAALGVDPARIAVGGQSAGGSLAAGLVQRLRDAGGVQPVAQWLLSPMLDDRTAADRALDDAGQKVWTNALNRFSWRGFLGREPGAADVPPYAVPARARSLAGLPPAWIGVGLIDLFHDEDRAYADRLREAGVPTVFDVEPGAPHGFEAWAPDSAVAKAYLARARAWLSQAIGGGAAPEEHRC
jgi:acetyl esterase/lipase